MKTRINKNPQPASRDHNTRLTLCAKTVSFNSVKSKEGLTEASRLIAMLAELMRLKAVPRMGWLLRGVRDVESVAAHSFGVAFIAMLLADRAKARGMRVDIERVLRMALLHDLTEARTGDLPNTIKQYFESANLKAADERVAKEMLNNLGITGEAYLGLLRDYEHRASLEARLVKAADKLDLLLQASEYEKGGARNLQEFWESAEEDFARLELEDLIEDLVTVLKERRHHSAV
ncbi:MAG: HD family hydrolase [Acidobacteria bacterium]|nr:HD family hydrolase [Acidobacteriota bacterium]